MALVEYVKQQPVLVEQDESRHPLDLLENHFLFVYERCSAPVCMDETQESAVDEGEDAPA